MHRNFKRDPRQSPQAVLLRRLFIAIFLCIAVGILISEKTQSLPKQTQEQQHVKSDAAMQSMAQGGAGY
jgi:hypothetical protein